MVEEIKIVDFSVLSSEQKKQLAGLERDFYLERLQLRKSTVAILRQQARFEHFAVAMQGNQPIGFVSGSFGKKNVFKVSRLFVANKARGNSVSKRLLAKCLAIARPKRATIVFSLPNVGALRSYYSLGRDYYLRFAERKRKGKQRLNFSSGEPAVKFVKTKPRK